MRPACMTALMLTTLSYPVCIGLLGDLARAQEITLARPAVSAGLKGADPTDCAQANSDYERYELGCPVLDVLTDCVEAPASQPTAARAAAIIRQSDR
jgi:hypothetical protein